MAPPNPGYSESVQELKSYILSKAATSSGVTLSQFKTKVTDLWNALLNENFVFSFRNTLEMAVYKNLKFNDPNLGSHKVLSPDSDHSFPLEEPSPYHLKSCSPSYSDPSHSEPLPGYDHPEPRGGYHLALSPRIEITPSREHFQHDPFTAITKTSAQDPPSPFGPRSPLQKPSPHGRHEDPSVGGHYHSLGDSMNGYGPGQPGLMPTKIVKTANQLYTLYPENNGDTNYLVSCDQELKTKPAPEPFFVLPQIWSKPLVQGLCSIPVSSLPPLEWPLPSRTDQYELHIEVQPRPHHRAHYETEGSRGAQTVCSSVRLNDFNHTNLFVFSSSFVSFRKLRINSNTSNHHFTGGQI
ncbi:hypothetical protein WMY93_027665 [Mugilogobius chulae]|uniref:Uncharacterized protein n=1 Tax=Mugilogobius chulae TaxID=88201 RepID=A0AAW0MXW3_9GOBI